MTDATTEPQETDIEQIKSDLVAAWDLADKDIHTKVDFALSKLAELWHEVKGDAAEVVETNADNSVQDTDNQSVSVPPQPQS